MRALGIDPGTNTTGYGVVDMEGDNLSFAGCGELSISRKVSFPVKLKEIYDGILQVIDKYKPDFVVVEDVFFAKNANSSMKLGQAKGAAILAAVNSALPVFEYTPLQVKRAVAGYGAAKKWQIQRMVATLLGIEHQSSVGGRRSAVLGDIPEDAADALALAICHLHSRKIKDMINRTSGIGRRNYDRSNKGNHKV